MMIARAHLLSIIIGGLVNLSAGAVFMLGVTGADLKHVLGFSESQVALRLCHKSRLTPPPR